MAVITKKPEPPMGMRWQCVCGRLVFQQIDFCPDCVAAKPVPKPAPKSTVKK